MWRCYILSFYICLWNPTLYNGRTNTTSILSCHSISWWEQKHTDEPTKTRPTICPNPCCHWLSPTHFPHYFCWMKQSWASVATPLFATHSILCIVIQVGIHAPSMHEVHFQFTLYIYYPACTYYSSLWILTRLIPLSPPPLLHPFPSMD